jgi:hypothetical protein
VNTLASNASLGVPGVGYLTAAGVPKSGTTTSEDASVPKLPGKDYLRVPLRILISTLPPVRKFPLRSYGTLWSNVRPQQDICLFQN